MISEVLATCGSAEVLEFCDDKKYMDSTTVKSFLKHNDHYDSAKEFFIDAEEEYTLDGDWAYDAVNSENSCWSKKEAQKFLKKSERGKERYAKKCSKKLWKESEKMSLSQFFETYDEGHWYDRDFYPVVKRVEY